MTQNTNERDAAAWIAQADLTEAEWLECEYNLRGTVLAIGACHDEARARTRAYLAALVAHRY